MHIRSGKAIFVLLFRKVRVRESLSRLLTKDSSRCMICNTYKVKAYLGVLIGFRNVFF